MTSPRDNLGALIGVAVKAAVKDAMARTRTPTALSGTIEQLDDDKDVVWVRVDDEAIGIDPTESSNYEEPGVIPVAREGDAFTGDLARVRFEAAAGASATRTGSPNVIVLPYGAETGRRIVIDGDQGFIAQFDENNSLVGLIDTDVWAMGQLDPPGARGTFDPQGGFRMRSADDRLVLILDQNGLSLRDPVTGLVTAEIGRGHLRLVDPLGTDDIEMVTDSGGTLPNPVYRVAAEANPAGSLVAPIAPLFPTKPPDDIEIMHVAAWIRAVNNTAATMTPPAGADVTERLDATFGDADGTLHTSIATRDVATGAGGTFTDSLTNWQHAIGTTIIIKGGGTTSPSFRSISTSTQKTSGGTTVASIDKPAGLVVGDVMLAFITMGVNGGFVPSWITPPGFILLGAFPITVGSGAAQSTLAVGVAAKLADAADVAATSFATTFNLPTGIKMIHGAMVAIQNPFLVPGGVQLRMAGKPTRRELDRNLLTAANRTLCDFQNISQAYDNLEIVIDGIAQGGGSAQQLVMRFNNDNTGHYAWRSVRDGGPLGGLLAQTDIRMLGLSGTAGSRTSGEVKIIGYKTSSKPTAVINGWWTDAALAPHHEDGAGQWDGNAGVSAVNRIQIIAVESSPGSGVPQFAAGSRAILYGY
jgi:hypothetical protein